MDQMKLLIMIFFTIIFSSCYTQIDIDHLRHSYHPDEISDSIAFFPDADFEIAGGTISDLTGKIWRIVVEEETAVEQIFRTGNSLNTYSGPRLFEAYFFFDQGNCSFSSDRYIARQPQIRWRLLKSNSNILLIYTVSAKIYRKIRIEELSSDYLKIVVLE